MKTEGPSLQDLQDLVWTRNWHAGLVAPVDCAICHKLVAQRQAVRLYDGESFPREWICEAHVFEDAEPVQ